MTQELHYALQLPQSSRCVRGFFPWNDGDPTYMSKSVRSVSLPPLSASPLADRVVVCDGRRVARQGNKGDQVDADRLSELLRLGGLRPVYHGRRPGPLSSWS